MAFKYPLTCFIFPPPLLTQEGSRRHWNFHRNSNSIRTFILSFLPSSPSFLPSNLPLSLLPTSCFLSTLPQAVGIQQWPRLVPATKESPVQWLFLQTDLQLGATSNQSAIDLAPLAHRTWLALPAAHCLPICFPSWNALSFLCLANAHPVIFRAQEVSTLYTLLTHSAFSECRACICQSCF